MKTALCILFLFFTATPIIAQKTPLIKTEYSYRHFTRTDGLPTEIAESIFQDSQGFIWIGTERGFACYDGFEFKSYLGDTWSIINRIEENEKGEIVAYTYQDVFVLDRKTDNVRLLCQTTPMRFQVQHSMGLPNGFSIYNDLSGNNVIYRLTDAGMPAFFRHPRLNDMRWNQRLYWDRNERIFYIPNGNGIYAVDENGTEKYFYDNVSIDCVISAHGAIWAVGNQGVFRKEENEFKCVYRYNFFNWDGLFVISAPDSSIIIQEDKRILRYKNGEVEELTNDLTIVRGLMIDRESNLWAVSRRGIYNFFNLKFKNYILPGKSDVARSIVACRNGDMIFTTQDGSIFRLNEEQNEQKTLNYPHQGGRIESFLNGAFESRSGTFFFPRRPECFNLQKRSVFMAEPS